MKRREFITLLGGVGFWAPRFAQAQQSRSKTIGVFSGMSNEGQGRLYIKTLRERLETLGWVEGRNARVNYRWASGNQQRINDEANEMIASRPDVIVAITTPVVSAVRRQTKDIPLVFANMSDPVDGGFVQSMARPGGNMTGFTSFEYSIGGKWIELLKETVPALKHVLVLYNPDNYTSRALLKTAMAAADALNINLTQGAAQNATEIETIVSSFGKEFFWRNTPSA